MSGVTDIPFRLLCKRLAAGRLGMLVSEFVSVEAIVNSRKRELAGMQFRPEERPFCIQIFGGVPEHMAEGGRAAEALGADLVEINAGCPVPKIVKKGGGSALLRDLPRLGHILEQTRAAVNGPLSLKVRLGWGDGPPVVRELLHMAQEAGLDLFVVHGRTRLQGYAGLADWEQIGDIKAHAKIPVVGNGDIRSAEEAAARLDQYGLDGVSVGRGAMHNPWLFAQVADLWEGKAPRMPSAQEQQELFARYIELMEEHGLPENRILGRLKQMGARVVRAIDGGEAWRRPLLHSQSVGEFTATLGGFYGERARAGLPVLFDPLRVEELNGGAAQEVQAENDYR